mgnify:CR=1 FL=1
MQLGQKEELYLLRKTDFGVYLGESMEYVATCLFGLESLLGAEIDALGYKRTETMDGRVSFEGDESAVAR